MREIIVDPADIAEWRKLDQLKRSDLTETLLLLALIAVGVVAVASGANAPWSFMVPVLFFLGVVVTLYVVTKAERKTRESCEIAKQMLLRKYSSQYSGVFPKPQDVRLPEEWSPGDSDRMCFLMRPVESR